MCVVQFASGVGAVRTVCGRYEDAEARGSITASSLHQVARRMKIRPSKEEYRAVKEAFATPSGGVDIGAFADAVENYV